MYHDETLSDLIGEICETSVSPASWPPGAWQYRQLRRWSVVGLVSSHMHCRVIVLIPDIIGVRPWCMYILDHDKWCGDLLPG